MQIKDGRVSTLPIIGELSSTLSSSSKTIDKKYNFNFTSFGGDFKIWHGGVVTDNFKINGPQMNIAAMMGFNLVTGKLGGEVKVIPVDLTGSITEAIPFEDR